MIEHLSTDDGSIDGYSVIDTTVSLGLLGAGRRRDVLLVRYCNAIVSIACYCSSLVVISYSSCAQVMIFWKSKYVYSFAIIVIVALFINILFINLLPTHLTKLSLNALVSSDASVIHSISSSEWTTRETSLYFDRFKDQSQIMSLASLGIEPFDPQGKINAWDIYPPDVSCPDLIRIGNVGDGKDKIFSSNIDLMFCIQ
jgi:hypothetical protein